MEAKPCSRRLALLLEYDGTGYGGSQYQKNAPTVQGALERALSSLTGEPIRVALAGRTDAGVHAGGQVASFVTSSARDPDVFRKALNALLPADISVRDVAGVPLTFDPRRHAASRWYRYTFDIGPSRSALRRLRVWHIGRQLDLAAMSQATALLPGPHDFAAFAPPHAARRGSTWRTVRQARVMEGKAGLVHFDIETIAFLSHMVRRLAASLVAVGGGKLTVEDFGALIQDAVAGKVAATAPPRGLCLMKVRYESGLFDDETDEDI